MKYTWTYSQCHFQALRAELTNTNRGFAASNTIAMTAWDQHTAAASASPWKEQATNNLLALI